MKKLMLFALLTYAVSCSNPEDKVTGNPDSTRFNQSGNNKNFNTATDRPGNQAILQNDDTSSSPATLKENANSKTEGTNRSYVPGVKDSAGKK